MPLTIAERLISAAWLIPIILIIGAMCIAWFDDEAEDN